MKIKQSSLVMAVLVATVLAVSLLLMLSGCHGVAL
jgi:hypothetical protein